MDRQEVLAWRRSSHGAVGSLRLVDATLVDPGTAERLDDGYVEIAGGRIARFGGMTALVGRSDQVISVEGRAIIPGLIDAHAHLVYSGYAVFRSIGQISAEAAALDAAANAERVLRAGYTTVRDLGTIGNVAVALRDAVRRGQVQGPRIVASGRVISSSQGPQYEAEADGAGFSVRADGVEAVVAAVQRQVAEGVDNIKLMASGVEAHESIDSATTTFSEAEIKAAVRAAHAHGRTVAVHAQSYDAATFALRAGADTIEHGTRLDDEAVALLARRESVLVPTLSTLYSVKELGEELKLLPKQREEMAMNEPLWVASLAAARAAGALIAAGGDVGNRYRQGQNAKELGHLARSGFSSMEALRAATVLAARALRIESEVGSLELGKRADLVVLAKDPLADLDMLLEADNIVLVIMGGVPVSGALLDQ